MKYNVHDIIRIHSLNGFHVWKVTAVLLGAPHTTNHYELTPLDQNCGSNVDGKTCPSLIPCCLLDSHPSIQKV